MKQFKFLVIALTLLMGVSFTSCMGESDPTVGGTFIMKVVEPYSYSFSFSDTKVKYTAINSAELMTSSLNLNYGDIVQIAWSYNSDEQPVTDATKEVKVKVNGIQNISASTKALSREDNGVGEMFENATITKIGIAKNYGNDQTGNGNDQTGIGYFNKDIIIIPVVFFAQSDLTKHQFTLVYDRTKASADDTVLTLYMRHNNLEEKPAESANVYRAFDIANVLSEFKGLTGKAPMTIKIFANETDKANSYALADAKKELQPYEVEYKFEEEK